MIDPFEPYVEPEDPCVWCPKCYEEAEINEDCRIECSICKSTFSWRKLEGEPE